MSPLQKQPCKPKPWHFLHRASETSSYVLDHEQICPHTFTFPSLRKKVGLIGPYNIAPWRLWLISVLLCKLWSCLLIVSADERHSLCIVEIENVRDVTDVSGFFFTTLTGFLSSTAVVFLGRRVWCLLLGMPVSFFFRTFQVVAQAIPSACASSDFPFILSFKMACFSPKDSSLVCMLVYLFEHKCSLHRQNPRLKPRVDTQNNLVFNYSNRTNLGNKKHLSVTCSKTFAHLNGYNTIVWYKRWYALSCLKIPGNKSLNSNLSSHVHIFVSN